MKTQSKTSAMIKRVALIAIGLSCAANLHAQGPKIGFVNTERIFHEAAPAKNADAKLVQEFSKRNKELQDMAANLKSMSDKFGKDAPVLSESDRLKRQRELAEFEKDFRRKQGEFRDDLNQRRNEEKNAFLERTTRVIKQIAEAEKFDIVVQDAVSFSPRVDITEKVLKALEK